MGANERGTAARLRNGAGRLLRGVLAHDLPQLAAALTYFTALSLFPALIVVVALLGLVGLTPDTLRELLDAVGELGAAWATELVSDALDSILTARGSGVALSLGALITIWVASGYVGAFMWASNRIYEVEHRPPFWRGLPLRVALAVLLLAVLTATAAVIALVGPFGEWVASHTGIGTGALHLWEWIRWPILIALGLLMFGLLYRFAPARRQPAFWRLLAGAAVGVALWVAASVAFSFYLANFASYNRVYGTLGAAIAFLVWTWIMNLALLVGVEVNRGLERRAAL